MSSEANRIVQKLWSYCTVLRDDGLSYGDYLEQLSVLLFLKLAHEQTQLEFPRFRGQLSCHPKGYISTNLSAILECYWAVVTNRGMASLRVVVAINPEGQVLQQLFGSSQES